MFKNLEEKKIQKETRKALAIKQKAAAGKSLSNKEKEKLRILKTKLIYDKNNDYSLILKNIKKYYGSQKILKGVSFKIRKGERLALVGKNGSGKSTLINIISQQTRISEGEILYGYAKNRLQSLEFMGIQFQILDYPEGFVVKDVIQFFNVSVDKTIRMSKTELSELIEMFGIDKYLNRKIDRLSGGQQQRINILLALIKKPKLLILDEISTGLDVESAEIIKGYIESYLEKNPETSLLLVSHSDEEIRELTSRVVVLEDGKIKENFSSEKLTNRKLIEITSRERNLNYEQKKAFVEESNQFLSKLNKKYNIKPRGLIGNYFKKISDKISRKFLYINNEDMKKWNLLEIRDLSKTYGRKVGAVQNLTLNIEKGERVAITGPNGSGKSSLIEMIAKVKTKDADFMKFFNKTGLAKSDFLLAVKKLREEEKNLIKKKILNYELHKNELENRINILKKDYENEYKKIRINEAEKNISENSSRTNELILKKIDTKKQELNILINDIKKDFEDNFSNFKSDLIKYKKELHKKNLIKEILLEANYYKRLEEIKIEENISKKDNTFFVDEFKIDNKIKPNAVLKKDLPTISYSFANIPREVKNSIGVQFQYASFPVEMSVLDVILFFARTNENFMSKNEIIDAIKVFKLERLLKQKAYKLSGGEKQRLNVLLSIMKSPKLLILDEISTGLDIDSILKIDEFIKNYLDKTGATLILISHNYHEVHSLTDKIIVMKYGKLTEIVNTSKWSLNRVKEKMRNIYKGEQI